MKDIDSVQERREFLRVDYEAPIEVSIFANDIISKIPQGMTKNISACGVLFNSKKNIPVGELIIVKLEANTLNNVIEIDDSVITVDDKVLGRVVRVEEIVSNKEFDIGVCFIRNKDYDEEDVQKIIKILS